jgi:hypothetical protein
MVDGGSKGRKAAVPMPAKCKLILAHLLESALMQHNWNIQSHGDSPRAKVEPLGFHLAYPDMVNIKGVCN